VSAGIKRRVARLARLTALTALLVASAASIGTAGAAAAVEVPFATQFATSVRGGVATAANTLMTCPASAANCLESRAGTATGAALNNNAYAMERVDVDSDPTTFDSSTATLTVPAGATVQFAGLYYGARLTAGKGGVAAANAAARGSVLLKTPGALAYSALTATVADSTGIANAYVGSVDVTAQVAAAGSGEYIVANVQSGTGEDRYAGWSLVVVYADPASPPRSIRVFNGLASIVAAEAPLSIAVAGLETPPTGTVTAEAGLVGYEGDRNAAGDKLSLAGQNLSDAANPANNVFNSSIAVGGVDVTAKNPNYVNQLGFDSDLIAANGFLGNSVTETTLTESTSLDQYLTEAIVLAVELNPAVLEPEPPTLEPPAPEPPVTLPVMPPPAETTLAPVEAPPAEPVAVKEPEPHHKEPAGGESSGGGSGGSGGGEATAPVELEIAAPEGVVRPSAVVALRATVAAPDDAPLHDVEVCNTLPSGLTRLRATGASEHGDVACWHLAELSRGQQRSFTTTARVDATAASTLLAKTVVRARGARTARRTTRFHVAPLPPRACGSSLTGGDRGRTLLRC
jgi:hypothetical protein